MDSTLFFPIGNTLFWLSEESELTVQKTKNTSYPDEKTALPEAIPPETPKQLVEHPKYGLGTIISETEDTIVIQFDDCGEKEMLKAFSPLKKIPNNN